jgi:tRNA(Ile)-lysidine synthase
MEIEAYLKERGQDFCLDSTNADTVFSRNKLRGQVFPLLEEINPKTVSHMAEAGKMIQETVAYVDVLVDGLWSQYVKENICLQELTEEATFLQKQLMYRFLCHQGGNKKDIHASHVNQVLGLFRKQVGKELSLPHCLEAKRSYEGIIVEKKDVKVKKEEYETEYPLTPGIFQNLPSTDMNLELCLITRDKFEEMRALEEKRGRNVKKKYTKYLDYDKIEENLVLRKRMMGDYFVINKDGGRQKLKKFWVNEKISPKEREDTWLVADGPHILWAIGYRTSEAVKVRPQTVRILKLQLHFGGEEDGSGESQRPIDGRRS